MKLSDIRPESITSLPACWPRIVKKWLLGETSEEIARDPEVAQGVKGTMQVSTVIDDLCDYRLPWGFNALHSFLAMESAALEDWLEVTELPVASFYFSSMVRYGVPSPVATILLAMGMESRRAAIVCADRYPGTILPSSVLDWASSLTESEVCGWDLGSSLCDTVLKFGASLGQQRQVSTESKIRFTISIPNQAYVSPFADGTPLIAQARPPNGIVFYSSAVERLGMVTSNDPEVFRQVEVGQMTAVVSGDVGESHDAWRELEVVLVSVGRQAVVLDEVRTVPA